MKTIINKSNLLCALAVGLLGLPAPAKADTLTLNDGGVTKLEVVARAGGGANQIENLSPTSIPFNGSHVAVQSDSRGQATYYLGPDEFTITSSGTRMGSLDSRANVQPVIFFSVSVDTRYNIRGTFSVDDPGLSAKYAEFTTTLADLNTSANLFHNSQASRGVVDTSFVLGGAAGNRINELTGSATGILTAGHQYRLYYGSSIYADNSGDPASFVGDFKLEFQPVSNSSGNLILNGGFESPAAAPNSIQQVVPSSWSGGTEIALVNGQLGTLYPLAHGASQYALVGHQATLSQSFTITNAGNYSLAWFDSSEFNGLGHQAPYKVQILGVASDIIEHQTFDANASALNGWASRTMEFRLQPGSYTLRFVGLAEQFGEKPLIDDVSLRYDADSLISIRCSAVDICWAGHTNRNYQVQYSTLVNNNWIDLGSAVVGSGTNCFTDHLNVEGKRFYRVVRVP